MNEKEIIEKMKKLKEYRDNKINGEQGKVLDVKYLGDISEEDKKALAIYMVIERYKKDGEFVEIEQYYSEDLQTGVFNYLAGDNKNDEIEKIFLSGKYTDSEQREFLEKELNDMSKEGLIDLADIEKMEKVAEELGIDIEEIQGMTDLNAEQELDQEEVKETNPNKDEEEQDLTKKETEKLTRVAGKQEVNINAKFDGKNTLRKELGLSDEYKSIVVVYSEKLKEIQGEDAKDNFAPVAFVALKKDGSAHIVDSLELDTSSGFRPTKEAIKIDADGTARQDRETLARYKTPKGYLSIQRGQYGEMKVYHGQKTLEENRPVEFQLETNSIKPTRKEMKDLQRPGQGKYYIDNIEDEVAEHVKHGEKELKNKEDYDGNRETASHLHNEENETHFNNIEAVTEQWTQKLMENEDIGEAFTNNEVKEMVKRYIENNEDVSLDDIEKNIEKDAEMYLDHQRNSH